MIGAVDKLPHADSGVSPSSGEDVVVFEVLLNASDSGVVLVERLLEGVVGVREVGLVLLDLEQRPLEGGLRLVERVVEDLHGAVVQSADYVLLPIQVEVFGGRNAVGSLVREGLLQRVVRFAERVQSEDLELAVHGVAAEETVRAQQPRVLLGVRKARQRSQHAALVRE